MATPHAPFTVGSADSGSARSACSDCTRADNCFLLPVRRHGPEAEAAFGPLMHLTPGAPLFSRGAPFRRLYGIREGILARWQESDTQAPTVVGFYLPGDVAGLGGLGHGHYRFTVTAVTPTVVCPLDWRVLESIEDSEIARLLQKAMAWQGEIDGWQRQHLMLPNPRQRVEGCLHSLRRRRECVEPQPNRHYRIAAELLANHLGVPVDDVRRWTAPDADDAILL